MQKPSHIDIRDARDRVIDLLGLGETYPIRNVEVSKEVKVAFNKPAQLKVEPAQDNVEYQLRDANGIGPQSQPDEALTREVDGHEVPIAGVGTGDSLELTTFPIVEDGAYRIVARKRHPLPGGGESLRDVALRQVTQIKVGLDLGIPARVVVGNGTVYLSKAQTANTAPRLIDFGQAVVVDVIGGQEGVDYQLIVGSGDDEQVVSVEDVRGKGEGVTVQLRSILLHEDILLKIRATKKYTISEGRALESEVLDIALPVCVRANRALAIESLPGPVLDYAGTARIRVGGTQTSASYQLFVHRIRDGEIYPAHLRPEQAVVVSVDHGETVGIARPPAQDLWTTPAGYTAAGEPISGNGGAIEFVLPNLIEGHVAVVKVTKLHHPESPVRSHVPVTDVCAILVRPDTNRRLAMSVTMHGQQTDGTVRVSGGQPGVYYQLRVGDVTRGQPVYFHKRDDADASINKGLGQLTIGEDFTVSRTPVDGDDRNQDLSRRAPAMPELEVGAMSAGTSVYFDARDALTGLTATLQRTAVLGEQAAIRLKNPGVDKNSKADVLVIESQAGDRYHLVHRSQQVGSAVDGSGETLAFTSATVTVDDWVEVHVVPIDPVGVAISRVVPLVVPLNPRADLACRILGPRLEPQLGQFGDSEPKVIHFGQTIEVEVDASQTDVEYHLFYELDGQRIRLSDSVRGTGQSLTLRSTPIHEDCDIRVFATRQFHPPQSELPQPQVELAAVLPLKVRANRGVHIAHNGAPATVYGEPALITIHNSQRSTQYVVHAHRLEDSEFLYTSPPEHMPHLSEGGEGWGPVFVHRPQEHVLWQDLAGFQPLAGPTSGNDGSLTIELPSAERDLVVVVEAYKQHQVDERTVRSSVQVSQAVLVLVQPNQQPHLVVTTGVLGETTTGEFQCASGEPGVFYRFHRGDTELGQVYAHQRDTTNPQQNKGIDQLRLGLDFVLTGNEIAASSDQGLRRTTPPTMRLATGELSLPASIDVLAIKARTGVSKMLEAPLEIASGPQVEPVKTPVSVDEVAQIRVVASRPQERYTVVRGGETVVEVGSGTGETITLDVGQLTETTAFEVVVVDTSVTLAARRVIELMIEVAT